MNSFSLYFFNTPQKSSSKLSIPGRVLEDDWKVTRAREQGLTAGGPRRLKTVVSTVKNLLAVSRDAKSWQDQIKQMQVKVNFGGVICRIFIHL